MNDSFSEYLNGLIKKYKELLSGCDYDMTAKNIYREALHQLRCCAEEHEKRIVNVPNCSLCTWARTHVTLAGMPISNFCEAQGKKPLTEAYNTEACRGLYKEEAC